MRSSGTIHNERKKLPWPEGKPFRILSIDGGGIRGIFPAALLAEFEARYLNGSSVGAHFDMIAGTSTGGIIALALSVGVPASQIKQLYLKHGAEIFPRIRYDLFKIRKRLRWLSGLRNYQYKREPLENQLRKLFGQTRLESAMRRLCVPSFDGFTEVNIFKTPHHPDYKLDWREELVTVALATAAAPTFFPVYKSAGRCFADGGVWANNPVMIALVDALACYSVQRRDISILSIGCGDSEIKMTEKQIRLGGIWHWREIISSAMHLQSQNALGQAGLLIGRDKIIRLNAPQSPTDPIGLDDFARASIELPPAALRAADLRGEDVQKAFLTSRADAFPSYHGLRSTGQEVPPQ